MDKQRAKEIVSSPIMADVTYNQQKVYIEHVNESKETANVYPLNQPNQKQEVPLNNLREQ